MYGSCLPEGPDQPRAPVGRQGLPPISKCLGHCGDDQDPSGLSGVGDGSGTWAVPGNRAGGTELGGWAEEGVTGTGEGLGWENGTGLGRRG